jgi:prepilin-type processing-associated H-X9-DG protein
VVIAIIGILAAMVFPVFARARESARKAVCLSNVKNLALAVQMYLADNNDTLPPYEHRQEAIDFFGTAPGGAPDRWPGPCFEEGESMEAWDRVQWFANMANPYITWPVVLDEYVKNRDVWSCPSAKIISGATFILPGPDWLGYLEAHQGEWGGEDGPGPCTHGAFPPGWGGVVTDSILQQRSAVPGTSFGGGETGDAAHKAFVQTIATNEQVLYEKKLAQFEEVVRVPIVGDGGFNRNFFSVGTLAYPDVCCAECAGIGPFVWGWGGAAAGLNPCPDGSGCPDCANSHALNTWWSSGGYDVEARKASTRHLGGVNVGWLDGHASWVDSQRLIAMSEEGELEAIGWTCAPMTSAEGHEAACGSPPQPGMVFLYTRGGQTANWD